MEAINRTDYRLGYTSYGAFITNKINANVPTLDCISLDVKSVSDGNYKITRKMGIVVRKDASKEVRAFVDRATGDEAHALMENKGYGSF